MALLSWRLALLAMVACSTSDQHQIDDFPPIESWETVDGDHSPRRITTGRSRQIEGRSHDLVSFAAATLGCTTPLRDSPDSVRKSQWNLGPLYASSENDDGSSWSWSTLFFSSCTTEVINNADVVGADVAFLAGRALVELAAGGDVRGLGRAGVEVELIDSGEVCSTYTGARVREDYPKIDARPRIIML